MAKNKKIHILESDGIVKGNSDFIYLAVGSKIFEITEETIADIRKNYSSEGNDMTLSEISEHYSLDKNTMRRLLSSLNITHDSPLHTNEDLLTKSVDELVEDSEFIKLSKIRKSIEQKRAEKVVSDADKWKNFEFKFKSLIEENSDKFCKPIGINLPKIQSNKTSEYCLLLPITDFHYGKYGSDMSHKLYPYNRFVALNILNKKLESILNQVIGAHGVPSEIIFPIGSDWFHTDNFMNSTTRGTPQDTDGTYDEIFVNGCNLVLEIVEILQSLCDSVSLIYMPGNHDNISSMALYYILWERYKDNYKINITDPVEPGALNSMQSLQYGDIAIVTHHGDKINAMSNKTQNEIFANLVNNQNVMGYNQVLFLTGDRHHDKCEVMGNVRWEQSMSLAGSDLYHNKSFYGSTQKGLCAYVLDPELGLKAKYIETALPKEYQQLFAKSNFR